MSEWISCSDKLPRQRRAVLMGWAGKKGLVYVGHVVRKSLIPYWYDPADGSRLKDPTHWMPLPDPPKGDV